MKGNFFKLLDVPESGETFNTLLNVRNVYIERIVSSTSRPGKLYLQEQDEWVLLLQGEAELQIGDEKVLLQSGDYLLIPAGQPHRVLKTATGTVWQAVHIY